MLDSVGRNLNDDRIHRINLYLNLIFYMKNTQDILEGNSLSLFLVFLLIEEWTLLNMGEVHELKFINLNV